MVRNRTEERRGRVNGGTRGKVAEWKRWNVKVWDRRGGQWKENGISNGEIRKGSGENNGMDVVWRRTVNRREEKVDYGERRRRKRM